MEDEQVDVRMRQELGPPVPPDRAYREPSRRAGAYEHRLEGVVEDLGAAACLHPAVGPGRTGSVEDGEGILEQRWPEPRRLRRHPGPSRPYGCG